MKSPDTWIVRKRVGIVIRAFSIVPWSRNSRLSWEVADAAPLPSFFSASALCKWVVQSLKIRSVALCSGFAASKEAIDDPDPDPQSVTVLGSTTDDNI